MDDPRPFSPPLLAALEEACQRFEDAWATGPPSIGLFVAGWSEPQRSSLVERLLRADIQHRRQRELPISASLYLEALPDHGPLIEATLNAGQPEAIGRVGPSSPGSTDLASLNILNDRYHLLEKIGEGGMAQVFRARDLEQERDVAIKVMKTSLDSASSKRFAREFRAIAGIEHPHCIRVYEFGETAEFPYFTMELFIGQPITCVWEEPLPNVLLALHQAASALDFVHGCSVIHRDVKPSNLLTQLPGAVGAEQGSADSATDLGDDPDSGALVQVKLSDFGLARFYDVPSSLSVETGFVGTVAYSAPEQISNQPIDHRADLYALGLVCFEVLTGTYPFEAARRAGVQKLMRAQLEDHPPRLRAIRRDLPAELEEIVMSYLAKDASERPMSAEPLQRVLAAQLGYESSEESAVASSSPPRPERIVVGRSDETAELDKLMRQSLSPPPMTRVQWARSPIPSAAFLVGEAGIGKSHLMREAHRTARRQGADVYEGRCFKGNLAPYHPFVEIVRQILIRLEQGDSSVVRVPDPQLATTMETAHLTPDSSTGLPILRQQKDSLRRLVANYSSELLRIAPDLRRWLSGEAFRQVDLNREANYVMRAVASFFVELGSEHGACLFIEDLQWADASTLDLLRHLSTTLIRNRERSVESNHSFSRLFICCSVRSGDAAAQELLHQLHREHYGRVIELHPMSYEECRELICRSLGARAEEASPEMVQRLHRQCQGNPYFISESVASWRDAGLLVRDDEQWRIRDSLDDSGAWPDSVRDMLQDRMETLSSHGRRCLGAAAVIGSQIDGDLLRELLSDLSEAEYLDAVDELLARNIVLERAGSKLFEFCHDLLREQAYEQLSRNRRRTLHLRVADVLEEAGAGRDSPERLAGHFYEAGEAPRAFRYLLEAGEAALASYAIDDALRHLRRAAELESEIEDPQQKMRLRVLTATAYSAAGKPQRSIQSHQRRLELSPDRLTTGQIYEEIGKLHFRVGDFDAAVEEFDRALAEVGYRRPRSRVAVLGSTALSMSRLLLPRWLHLGGAARKLERVRVAHGAFSTLELLCAQRDVITCAQAHARHLVLARQISEPAYLVHACSRQALLLGVFSLNWPALRAARRALSYARQAGDPVAEAVAKGHVGCVHYFAARMRDAERLLREALEVLDRRGDTWERMYFYHNLRHIYSITGDAQREIQCAKVEMQIGEAVQDPEGTCWGAYGMANAMARSGRQEEAAQYMERALGILAGRVNIVVEPTALQTYGYVHLQAGDYEAASDVLDQSCRLVERHWAFLEYTIRAYPLLVEAMLGPDWHDLSHVRTRKQLQRCARASRRARFWGHRFPNYQSHALRVHARLAWVCNQPQRAVQYLERAIKAAERIGANYDLARAYIDMSKVRLDGQKFEARGLTLLEKLDAVLPAGER